MQRLSMQSDPSMLAFLRPSLSTVRACDNPQHSMRSPRLRPEAALQSMQEIVDMLHEAQIESQGHMRFGLAA